MIMINLKFWQYDLFLKNAALKWFVIAFLVRLAAAIAIHLYSLANGFEGFYPLASGHDDIRYWKNANDIINGIPHDYFLNIYPYLLAGLFYITGPDILAGKILNVLLGSLSVYLGVALARDLSYKPGHEDLSGKAVMWAGIMLTFYPAGIFYSTQLVKDPFIVLMGVSALYLMNRLTCNDSVLKKAICGVLILAAVWCLVELRLYTAVLLLFSTAAYILINKRKVFLLILLAAAGVPYFLGYGFFGCDYLAPYFNGVITRLIRLRITTYSGGGSSAGINIDLSSWAGFLKTYLYSYATLMFGPFPWQVRSPVHLAALPEAVGMWLLSPLWLLGIFRIFDGLRRGRVEKETLLMIFSLALVAVIAMYSNNVGANTRLRILPWNAFMIYASLLLPHINLSALRKKGAFRS